MPRELGVLFRELNTCVRSIKAEITESTAETAHSLLGELAQDHAERKYTTIEFLVENCHFGYSTTPEKFKYADSFLALINTYLTADEQKKMFVCAMTAAATAHFNVLPILNLLINEKLTIKQLFPVINNAHDLNDLTQYTQGIYDCSRPFIWAKLLILAIQANDVNQISTLVTLNDKICSGPFRKVKDFDAKQFTLSLFEITLKQFFNTRTKSDIAQLKLTTDPSSLPLGTLATPLFSTVGKILAAILAEEESLKKFCITEATPNNQRNNLASIEMVALQTQLKNK